MSATAPVPVTVAPMRRRHLPEVLAIEAQVYPTPWSERLFADELGRSGRVYVVARVGARVVGYAGLLMIADDGHVATVGVDPAWQGHGIGRVLLGELVAGALALGANQLTLEVRMSNLVAQHLYQSFGFVPAGARKGYYADDGEDALVMWAHDIRSAEARERFRALAARPSPIVQRAGEAETDIDIEAETGAAPGTGGVADADTGVDVGHEAPALGASIHPAATAREHA